MKQPGFPSRLSESSTDPRVTKALEIAKDYEPAEARVRRALTRFDATRASEGAPLGKIPTSDGRPMFSWKAGALVAIVFAIGTGWTLNRSVAERPAQPSSTHDPAPAKTVALPQAEAPEPTPTETPAPAQAKTMRVEELPPATPKTSTDKPPVAFAPAAVSSASATSFDDELALVEAARTSLAKGDGAACLSELDRYDRTVRGGVFEREVAVMRIEALLARGEGARARSLGEAFLARSPESPYAARIRSLLTKIPTARSATP